jgi:phosphopantothenoylcysteine decarboxylase / phosphopantothenate---cysteine ligase
MSRILITSGPTRQYLDPVRYLTNASSGRMGAALAQAAIQKGHEVVIVSGPVEVPYPAAAEVIPVVTTEDMLEACEKVFPMCDGLIAVAAPCDYRPEVVSRHKIRKTGQGLKLHLVETPDVVARLAEIQIRQWLVAFALETEDSHIRAVQKLEQKCCDLIVLNSPAAIRSAMTKIEVLDRQGRVLLSAAGDKAEVSREIFRVIQEQLMKQGPGTRDQGSGARG